MASLAALRKNAGYDTQQKLADALDIKDRSLISRWESGSNYPQPVMIAKLAKTLETSEGEIIAAITETREGKGDQ